MQAFSTSCPTTLKAAGDDAPEGSACGDTSDAVVWFEERRHPGGHEGLGYAREDLCTREPQGGVMHEASSVLIVQCYFQKFRGGVSGATRCASRGRLENFCEEAKLDIDSARWLKVDHVCRQTFCGLAPSLGGILKLVQGGLVARRQGAACERLPGLRALLHAHSGACQVLPVYFFFFFFFFCGALARGLAVERVGLRCLDELRPLAPGERDETPFQLCWRHEVRALGLVQEHDG